MQNILYLIGTLVLSFLPATIQITGLDMSNSVSYDSISAPALGLSVPDPHQAPLLLLDPTRMCRQGTRKFRDAMNVIAPSTTRTRGGGGSLSPLDTNDATSSSSSNSMSAHTQRNFATKRYRRKVNAYCAKEAEVMREASHGAKLGTMECQHQFKHRHWNCSSHPKSIKRILARDTRETAFIHAIISAGVTYAVTQGCSSGRIQNCPCDRTLTGTKSKDGNWEWGGCGDNVNIGYKRSKDILDIKIRRQSDIRSLMMLHNNEAGRLAVRNHMRLVCKCHGLSGSCTLKTCWQKVPTFREIGERLKIGFDGSSKVISGNDGKSIIPATKTVKQPSREDLIYFEDSVDFCKHNKKTGSLGTTGRVCSTSSMGVDSCDILCCSRGHYSKIVKVKEYCRCKFQWCCEVSCEVCTMRKLVTTCR